MTSEPIPTPRRLLQATVALLFILLSLVALCPSPAAALTGIGPSDADMPAAHSAGVSNAQTTASLTLMNEISPAGATGFKFLILAAKWGSEGSGNGQFTRPAGVALDGAGNVYVADSENDRIQKFDGNGNYLAQWGSPGSGNGQFDGPIFVAVDGAGHVYVADTLNNRIQKFDGNGNYLDQWGSPGSGNGQFAGPYGVAVDGAGNVYVADSGNHRIQKFDGDGNFLAKWGSSGSGNGQFATPYGVAVSGAGYVYVADSLNYRIQKFDLNGNYRDQWGGQGSGDGQFMRPVGVAVDGLSHVYVADGLNHRIQEFDGDGNYLAQWGSQGNGDGQFDFPAGVAVHSAGHIYVTEFFNHRIQKFPMPPSVVLDDGESHTVTGLSAGKVVVGEIIPAGWRVDDVTCDDGSPVRDGNSVSLTLAQGDDVTCTFRNVGPPQLTIAMTTIPAGGTNFPFTAEIGPAVFATKWGEGGSGDGQFGTFYAVAVDGAGHVYVADAENNRIQKFDGDGNYLDQWGDLGLGNGQFVNPFGVAVDGAGRVYVADTGNGRIQMFDGDGNYLNKWGSMGTGDGQFNSPSSVAVDGAGRVYVADYNNHRIQKFDSNGNYLDQWGSLGDDDGRVNSPIGVAVDGAGHVYVADYNNHRIQKFDADGNYLDQWGGQGNGDGQLDNPSGVAVDESNHVYVADYGNNRVQRFDDDGDYVDQWGSLGSGDGQFNKPMGVAVDAAGHVYVSDTGNSRIQKFTTRSGLVLDDGDSQTLSNLRTGMMIVSELVPTGWALNNVICDGGRSVRSGDSVRLTLNEGDDVTCSFANIGLPDTTRPSVTINQAAGQADPTSASPIHFTAVFSEPVTGFTGSDVALGLGGVVGVLWADVTEIAPFTGETYDVAVSGMTTDGVVVAIVLPGVVQDAVGLGNTVSTSTDNTVTYSVTDTTPPSVTINQAAGQSDPTGSSPINFTAVFNEPVTGFACSDVTVGGTAGATTATVTQIAPNNGTTYNVAVNGMTGSGTVVATIAANVAQDAATNGNAASTSTDNSVTYNALDTTPPDTTLAGTPPNPSNSSSASFTFSSEAEATFECNLDNGGFDTCTSPKDYTGLSDGSHTFQVRAKDAAGNFDPTPAGFDWVIDTTPPDTTLTGTPSNPSNSGNAEFTFSSEDGATFQCNLDNGGFDTCTSPKDYTGLSDGSHTFQVRAKDAIGNVDPTPAGFDWVIDTTPPDTTLTGTPPNPSNSASAEFSFSSEDGATFQCNLDNGGFDTCTSPKDYTGLSDGSHTFQVRASDAVGNVDPTPAGFDWVIDTTPPDTTPDTSLDSYPPNPSTSRAAAFTFSGTNAVRFECALDGADFTRCTSPHEITGLDDGPHLFLVRAVNVQSQVDESPAEWFWMVDATPPAVTINQATTQTDPTTAGPIHFTVFFTEPVNDFSGSDVSLSGTAGATTAVVTNLHDHMEYDVAVSGMTGSGTVVASIAANVAHDDAGNGNTASTSTDNSVTYDPSYDIYVATATAGTVNGLAFGPQDILLWDGQQWSKWFNGAAAGLSPAGKNKHNIAAFWIPDPDGEEVVLSFAQNSRYVLGVDGKVDGMDLVWWDGDSFNLWFDGQDVGLSVLTNEKIDAVHVLDGDMAPPALAAASGGSCQSYLLISTMGAGKVPNYDATTIKFSGEDVLGFCMTRSGPATTGNWIMVLDGSTQGMPRNSTAGLAASADGGTIFLTTHGRFDVGAAHGGHSTIYSYNMASRTFGVATFCAADHGLRAKVGAVHMEN